MSSSPARLIVDCSIVMKWKLTTEPFAPQARELMLDGEQQAVEVCAPDQLRAEVVNAFLRSHRRNRLRLDEARQGLGEILAYPFTLFKTTPKVIFRAFEIAVQSNQHSYDCIYVALAEGKNVEFWTGDDRLHNALHSAYPRVRRIADYQRKRP